MPLDTMDRLKLRAQDTEARAAEMFKTPVTSKPQQRTSLLGEEPFISDGVRILDPVTPLELMRYHSVAPSSRLEVLQSWEGGVIDIDRDAGTFKARLYDLTNPDADVSEAEFDIRDVSLNDMDLLKPGGVFRWLIGYRKHVFGQQERVSAIIFRRLPVWTETDLSEARTQGESLARAIHVR